jgi:BMFP domain-containing protein YqiC
MDLVGRDEFEAVKQLASEARAEADALRERVVALEALLKDRA